MDLRMGEWHFRFINDEHMDGFGDSFDVWASMRVDTNRRAYLQPDGKMVTRGVGERLDDGSLRPFAKIPAESLQGLMNALWELGVRPNARRYEEETKLLREVLATQGKHLQDMRAMAFGEKRAPDMRITTEAEAFAGQDR